MTAGEGGRGAGERAEGLKRREAVADGRSRGRGARSAVTGRPGGESEARKSPGGVVSQTMQMSNLRPVGWKLVK